MKLRTGIVVGGIAVIAAAVIAAIALGGGEPMADSANPDATTSQSPMPEPTTSPPGPSPTGEPAPTAGAYVNYVDTAIADAEGRILLFFHASWCPQCRAIESDILADGVPDGVTIVKVDYDGRQDLRQQYGVTLQTTFVEVDSSGAALQSHVAYDEPSLDAVIAAMI